MPATLIRRRELIRPSWHSGFARNAAESMFPDLWRDKIAHWVPALGPTGILLRDVSGLGQHTSFNFVPADDWRLVEGGYSITFDGTDPGGLGIAEATAELINLPTTHNFTIVVTCNADVAAPSDAVFSWSGDDDLILYPNSTGVGSGGGRLFWRDLGSNIINEDGPDLSGVWQQSAFISRALDDHELYRDGVSVGTSNATGTAGPFDSFYIGSFAGSVAQAFLGKLEDIRIYKRVLNVNELRFLYEVPLADLYLKRLGIGVIEVAPVGDGPEVIHFRSLTAISVP